MRPLFTTIIILMALAQAAIADTTNRAIQVSPVPGVFVGGVGLFCTSENDDKWFLLLTRDREKIGVAKFHDDDVTYDLRPVTETTPEVYRSKTAHSTMTIDRRSLQLRYQSLALACESMSISGLHKAAETHLRELLSKTRI